MVVMVTKRIQHRGGLPPDKYLSREQANKLLLYVRTRVSHSCRNGSIRDVINEIIIELMLNSGLRAREVCRLQIRDLPHFHSKDVLYIRDSKGRVSRTVEVRKSFIEKLTHFVKTYRKASKPGSAVIPSEKGYRLITSKVYRKSKATDRMICEQHSEHSSRLTYQSLYSKIRMLGRKSGVGKLHPHMLRHTHLFLLYNVGADIRLVQDQAGHKDIRTTAIYAKTSPEARRRQIEGIDLP